MKKNISTFQLVIFFLDKQPYHAGVYIKNRGIADLSLFGSRIISLKEFDKNNYEMIFFNLNITNSEKIINFYREPCLLTKKIIDKERSNRGWFKTKESPNYILNFRTIRSEDIRDMNCIEWLVYGISLGGMHLPLDILTVGSLYKWAQDNLKIISEENNCDELSEFY